MEKILKRSFPSPMGMMGIAAAFVVVAILVFASTFYTIESGTVGVLSTFGKYDPVERGPGLHVKTPLIQEVQVFDVKLQTVHYKGNQDLPDRQGVVYKPLIRVLDNKNLPIGVELTVQYTPIADQASEILSHFGQNYFEKLINPIVRDVVRDVVGRYPAEKIAADRTAIAEEIRQRLGEKFKKLPFRLDDVALRDIQLPKMVLKKIEEVQLAKQEDQRLTILKQQALKQQEIKQIEAETRLIEVTTQARAQAERQRIEADAKAYRILKEAEATARANRLVAESLTDQFIRYKAVEKWDGKYPSTLFAGREGGLILNLPKGRP